MEKEDWKHIVDIVTNAKLVVSSIQDVANKLADYAKVVTTSASSGKSSCRRWYMESFILLLVRY